MKKLTRSLSQWKSKNYLKKSKRISSTFDGLQIAEKIEDLNAKSSVEGFWNDPEKAEVILKEIKFWNALQETWKDIAQKQSDLEELSAMQESLSEAEKQELEQEIMSLSKAWNKAHIKLFLNGKYDQNDALVVISAGTGGTDAQDWADMLLRMVLRWAEVQGFAVELLDKQVAQDAGIKSASVKIKGVLAYGHLKSEHGVHRLVRLSPFNAKNLRQTSFALIEVLPVITQNTDVEINDKDLRIDTFRASGAGGQHVNTTDSAVRITHLPTGLVVSCQSERSQAQNKMQAMTVLKGRLSQKLEEEKKDKLEELKGGYKEAAWGNQIRSYVFQPYTMVKDHRTGAETSQVQDVLDGNIDLFIEAYLLQSGM